MAEKMASSEFRLRYATLETPVVVTVLGRPIGMWTPIGAPEVPTVTAAAPAKATVSSSDVYRALAKKPKA